jgi:hypothetical protein
MTKPSDRGWRRTGSGDSAVLADAAICSVQRSCSQRDRASTSLAASRCVHAAAMSRRHCAMISATVVIACSAIAR